MKTIEAFETFFSLQGRLNRQNFAILMLTLAILLVVSEVFARLDEPGTFGYDGMAEPSPLSMAILVFQLGFFVASIFPIVRRWHDLDRSGAYWWLCQIPLLNFVFYCILLFAKGTNGPNRFGPDPLGAVGEAAEAELRTSVLRELEAAATEPATWAQALQEAQGDQDRARARYLDLRVAQLAKKLHRLQSQKLDAPTNDLDLSADHAVLLPMLDKLIDTLIAQERHKPAASICQRKLAVLEGALGLEHPDVAPTLEKLADIHKCLCRYSHAETLLQRAMAIREKSLGPEHPDVAKILHNLGVVQTRLSQYALAEAALQRALDIREKALGLEHPDVAKSLYALCTLYYAQGKSKVGLELGQRADRIVASSGTAAH